MPVKQTCFSDACVTIRFVSPLRAILFSALVLTGFVIFRANAVEPSEYLMDLWTSDDDLPDNSVTAITQTPDGYLWIGTYNGLARFDGVRFTNFDPANTPALKHARVNRLFTDAQGTLWINTFDGSMTSFRNGVFTHEWQGAEVVGIFSVPDRVYFATIASGMATCMEIRHDETAERIPITAVLMLLDRAADTFLARRSEADGWLIKPLDAFRLRKAARILMDGYSFFEGVDEATDLATHVGAP